LRLGEERVPSRHVPIFAAEVEEEREMTPRPSKKHERAGSREHRFYGRQFIFTIILRQNPHRDGSWNSGYVALNSPRAAALRAVVFLHPTHATYHCAKLRRVFPELQETRSPLFLYTCLRFFFL
jgi:hypothetical protein